MSGRHSETTRLLSDKAYDRQVRRYVQAPVHRFAAITPPELTPLCREELEALGFSGMELSEAGVEFQGQLSACYLANLWLRTAGRILCRFARFRAGAVEELFQKVSALRWELWLNCKNPLHIEAHVEYSRIEHEGLVADTTMAGIAKCFRTLALSAPRRGEPSGEGDPGGIASAPLEQRVLVRLSKNHCEISLDTTGTHLHQRGYRLEHTGAPLRETLAAALVMKAGWRGETPLVDGMCGAGTMPIEAALIARRLPPGSHRSFLFESWPAFQEKTWGHLGRKASKEALRLCPHRIIGVDVDAEVLAVARRNAERAGVSLDIQWENKDFFAFDPRDHELSSGLLLLNPPYGVRLEGGGKELYERLGTHLRRAFGGWRVAVLAPNRTLAAGLKLRTVRLWNIKHGGMPIVAALGRV